LVRNKFLHFQPAAGQAGAGLRAHHHHIHLSSISIVITNIDDDILFDIFPWALTVSGEDW